MKIVGLDLSLTSTGVAVTTDHGTTTHTIKSKATTTDLLDRCARLHGITDQILDYIRPDTDLVVVEGPAYSRLVGHQHERSGLWFIAVTACIRAGAVVVEVTPTARCKYATGKGNASKDHVLVSVVRRYPDQLVTGNDEADALVLAAMGARHLGHPIEGRPLPQANLAALDAIRWPEGAPAP